MASSSASSRRARARRSVSSLRRCSASCARTASRSRSTPPPPPAPASPSARDAGGKGASLRAATRLARMCSTLAGGMACEMTNDHTAAMLPRHSLANSSALATRRPL